MFSQNVNHNSLLLKACMGGPPWSPSCRNQLPMSDGRPRRARPHKLPPLLFHSIVLRFLLLSFWSRRNDSRLEELANRSALGFRESQTQNSRRRRSNVDHSRESHLSADARACAVDDQRRSHFYSRGQLTVRPPVVLCFMFRGSGQVFVE